MAGLDEPVRALIETWTGPLGSGSGLGSSEDAGNRVERLGTPEVVALEILRTRLGQLVWLATDSASGDDRSKHEKNIEATESLIGALVAAIEADDDLTLSDAAEKVVAQARAGSPGYTERIETTAGRARRAG